MEATQAPTPCNQQTFSFQALESRRVEVDFSGGYLSSDGGSVLLREIDSKRRFTSSLAACFSDHRCTPLVEHEREHLLAQRIHAIALGYENINDHDKLRLDPVLALSCNKADLLGEERGEENRGKALAGKSTLNRLELGSNGLSKNKKIEPYPERLRDFLIDEGVRRTPRRSRVITLDFDAILTWIEKQRRVHYVIGLAKNAVLKKRLAPNYETYLHEQDGEQPTTALALHLCVYVSARPALIGTQLENASVGQIRLKRFKIAAQLKVTVRRVYIRLGSACPMADVFGKAHANLQPRPKPS